MALLVALLLFAPPAKRAPFDRVDFDGDTVRVVVERREYVLRAVDGIETPKLLAHCRRHQAWQTRFRLHLVDVLRDLRGEPPGATVSLVLEAARSGERVTIEKAPMTRDRWRRLFWQQYGLAASRPAPTLDRALSEDQVKADGAQLEALLGEHFPFPERLAKLGEAPAPQAMTAGEFARIVAARLAPLGDPETHVVGLRDALEGRFLPFVIRPAGKGFVALRDGKLLNPLAPYVRALDARRPEEWLEAARTWLPHGTPAHVRAAGVDFLPQIEALRPFFRARQSGSVWLTLVSADGEVRLRMEHRLVPEPPAVPDRAARRIKILEGDVAYVPLPHMESEEAFERHVAPMLARLRETRAAILDLRGNASSRRALVRLLLPQLVDRTLVYNVAASRRPLDDIDLYPRDFDGWEEAERAAIAAMPPRASWKGSLHFGVVGPGEEGYRRPVAVLVDGGTRNAAEVFACALQASGRAILVGEPTGGSDGRPAVFALEHSRLRVAISTIVSMRPDGRTFLGNSLLPDVAVARQPGDWTGASDAQLEAARKKLR